MSNESNPIALLKKFTDARIGLGRTGNSVPTRQSLAFNLAHANARDAVYTVLAIDALIDQLKVYQLPVIALQSKAGNRSQYLQRPDLGRQLNPTAADDLQIYPSADVSIIIADGLSAKAVNSHANGLLNLLIPQIKAAGLTLSPIALVEHGRVAIADEIGHLLRAKISVILIGERPGLSAADSIGAYITFGPKAGLTDDARNCVSNIRPMGLTFSAAADKIWYLIAEALKRQISGVLLKDDSGLLE